MNAKKLPAWIKVAKDKPNAFYTDPDAYYPALLKELKVEKPDQYWLEVAYNFMKLDFDRALKAAGFDFTKSSPVNLTQAAEGYKDRWGLKYHPPGRMKQLEKEHGDGAWRQVAREARQLYSEKRG